MGGTNIIQRDDVPSVFVPPTLTYIFVSEMPVLLEGSILKNLLLGAKQTMHGRIPSNDQAWYIAKRCGLDPEYLHAPESFNVGKGGRNLPTQSRMAVCLARGILADPMVLMFHKPLALWPRNQRGRIYKLFEDFVKFGGLWGILSGRARQTGSTPSEFLIGRGTRTIIFTSLRGEKVPSVVDRVITFDADWDIKVADNPTEGEQDDEEEESADRPSTLRQSLHGSMRKISAALKNASLGRAKSQSNSEGTEFSSRDVVGAQTDNRASGSYEKI